MYKRQGYSWEVALTAVFVEGIIFIILSLTNVREAIFNAIPASLKVAVDVYKRQGSAVRHLSEQSGSECAAVLFGNELRFKRRRGLYAEWDLGWEYFRW